MRAATPGLVSAGPSQGASAGLIGAPWDPFSAHPSHGHATFSPARLQPHINARGK